MTDNQTKVKTQAEALYDLFQIFGRGRVTEEQFVFIYLKGDLPNFIKKVAEESEGANDNTV